MVDTYGLRQGSTGVAVMRYSHQEIFVTMWRGIYARSVERSRCSEVKMLEVIVENLALPLRIRRIVLDGITFAYDLAASMIRYVMHVWIQAYYHHTSLLRCHESWKCSWIQ